MANGMQRKRYGYVMASSSSRGRFQLKESVALSDFLAALDGRLGAPSTSPRLRSTVEELRTGLDPTPAKLSDPLRAKIVELVALTDRSEFVPPVPIPRQVLAICCRTLTGWLAERHPGRSVEVRVPPYAAVQCGTGTEGPTHTRGTPPNVVETDPITFIRMATGGLTWQAAIASGSVSASGQRADLSSMLPILRI